MCELQTSIDGMVFSFSSPLSDHSFVVFVKASALGAGPVAIEPHLTRSDGSLTNFAQVREVDGTRIMGDSGSGTIELDAPPIPGQIVTGYLDIEMVPVVEEAARFGVPCPRGRADCGSRKLSSGGAICATIADDATTPMCMRSCESENECSVERGAVCVLNKCTKPCTKNADCGPNMRCVLENPGQAGGCLALPP